MKFLQSYKLFENINQAKSILKSLNKDTNDDSYLKIRDVLKGHDGYVGWFTKLHYKYEYSLNSLVELWDLIKSNLDFIPKLPKQILTYENIEQLQDDLEVVKNKSAYNKILGEFPTKQRSLLKQSDESILLNLAKRKDNKGFFKKVSSYYNRTELIDAIQNFLSVDPNANMDKIIKISKEQGSDIVYYSYEDNILIVRVYNSTELNKIAGDCSWCIRNSGTFSNYVNKESKQFIIFLFDRIDSLSRIGVTARITSTNFYHTAHNKRDGHVAYNALVEILKEYNVDPKSFMSFKLEDVNINETSVKLLINNFNISKEKIIELKSKFTSSDISQFSKEEIEKWNLLDKAEITYDILIKYDFDSIISKKMLYRLKDFSISNIIYMYRKYGYKIIEYLKNNKDVLNYVNGEEFRNELNDKDFIKKEILPNKNPFTTYSYIAVGSTFSETDRYSYYRTLFRMLWFKDEIKEWVKNKGFDNILRLESKGEEILNFLLDIGISLDDIKNEVKKVKFDFDLWLKLISLYKERNEKVDDIIEYLYKYILSYSITDYEMKKYEESGIFNDKQLEDIALAKEFKEFKKELPSNPYDNNMKKYYLSDFYKKWKHRLDLFLPNVNTGYSYENDTISLLLMFTKLDKLNEIEKYDFVFKGFSGQKIVKTLSDLMSGTYYTNSGMKEELTEDECKKLYKFLTEKCDIKEINISYYSDDSKTIAAHEHDNRRFYLQSMYLYDRNEFENYLMYEVSNLKYNKKKDDVFIPALGDKTKNTTNRVYEVLPMFELFLNSKKKPNISEFEEFLNTLISFDLTLTELTYLIDIIKQRSEGYREKVDIGKNIKKMLLTELQRKTSSLKIMTKYTSFLFYR